MKDHILFLWNIDACEPAIKWAATQPNLETAWKNCQNVEWLSWFVDQINVKVPDAVWPHLAYAIAEEYFRRSSVDVARTREICEALLELWRRVLGGDVKSRADLEYEISAMEYAIGHTFFVIAESSHIGCAADLFDMLYCQGWTKEFSAWACDLIRATISWRRVRDCAARRKQQAVNDDAWRRDGG